MVRTLIGGRCVHCLRDTDSITLDHGLPDSWYPDTTPATVQRWTAPSCSRCNSELGRLEKDLLTRLVLCADPNKDGISGLRDKVFRSLGFDTGELSKRESDHRKHLREKILLELTPFAEVSEGPGLIPGFGPYENAPWAVPIPFSGISIVTEKIARVSEHYLERRFVEVPYGIRTSISDNGAIPEALARYIKIFDFGPGLKIGRLFTSEDPLVVRYWISIWGTLFLRAYVDREDELRKLDETSQKVEGITLGQGRAMQISSYLRTMSDGETD